MEPSRIIIICRSYLIWGIFNHSDSPVTTDIKGIRIMLGLYPVPSYSSKYNKNVLQEDGLDQYKAEVMMLFILNTLNIIGVGLLILYTGNGLLRLPCGLIRPTHGVRTRRTALEVEIDELE